MTNNELADDYLDQWGHDPGVKDALAKEELISTLQVARGLERKQIVEELRELTTGPQLFANGFPCLRTAAPPIVWAANRVEAKS